MLIASLVGSNPTASAKNIYYGEMAERLMACVWRAQKGNTFLSSNLSLSASLGENMKEFVEIKPDKNNFICDICGNEWKNIKDKACIFCKKGHRIHYDSKLNWRKDLKRRR